MQTLLLRKCAVAPLQNIWMAILREFGPFAVCLQYTQPYCHYIVSLSFVIRYRWVEWRHWGRTRIRCTMQVQSCLLLLSHPWQVSACGFSIEKSCCAKCATNFGAAVWKRFFGFGFCFYSTCVFLPRARRSVLFLRRRPKLIKKNNKTHYWQEMYSVYNKEIHLRYVHYKTLWKSTYSRNNQLQYSLYNNRAKLWIQFYSLRLTIHKDSGDHS